MTFDFDTLTLKSWFNSNKRDLPWRYDPTPYQVLVSEVMLQQTRVETVIPYFHRWMEKFPSVKTLAGSSQNEVIKLWEGLGYYSRARNLHEGAKFVMENFEGNLPSNVDDLKKIKGLGPYTIGAILSFAFKKKSTAVDGNVMRVLSRYFAIRDDISQTKTQKKFREIALEILPEKEPWVFNEAIIELGAIVCNRKSQCLVCPVKSSCQAHALGIVDQLPYKSKKINYEALFRTVAIIQHEDKILLKQVPKGKLMSGLHEFPYTDTAAEGLPKEKIVEWVHSKMKLRVSLGKTFSEVRQSFTRYRVLLRPFLMTCKNMDPVESYSWVNISELKNLPFSSGHKKIINQINQE
jgi:A/G-specific adenine glycosylase